MLAGKQKSLEDANKGKRKKSQELKQRNKAYPYL